MGVRCKFKCVSNEGGQIRLDAVTSGSPENEQFFNYTPSGRLSFGTVNAKAAEQLKVGDEYYIDIIPVPKAVDPNNPTDVPAA